MHHNVIYKPLANGLANEADSCGRLNPGQDLPPFFGDDEDDADADADDEDTKMGWLWECPGWGMVGRGAPHPSLGVTWTAEMDGK